MIDLRANLQKESQLKFKFLMDLKNKKNIVFEKNYWKISATHDGYLKNMTLFMRET